MKAHRNAAGVATLAMIFLACSGSGEAVQGPDVTPQASLAGGVSAAATGSGHVKRPDGSIRKFTINAVKHANGGVSGNYDLELGPLQLLKDDGITPPLLRFHGTITCMTVIGNSAYLGGEVRSHQNGELFFGRDDFTGVAIELIDHGEGPQAAPDEISSLFVYFPETPSTPQDYCDDPTPGPVFPIDQGNISVR